MRGFAGGHSRALAKTGLSSTTVRADGAVARSLRRDTLTGTRPTMQRLPELKRTPLRPRHPLVYGAGFMLFIALMAFVGRIGMFWVLMATTLAVVMAIAAIAIAVRAR